MFLARIQQRKTPEIIFPLCDESLLATNLHGIRLPTTSFNRVSVPGGEKNHAPTPVCFCTCSTAKEKQNLEANGRTLPWEGTSNGQKEPRLFNFYVKPVTGKCP